MNTHRRLVQDCIGDLTGLRAHHWLSCRVGLSFRFKCLVSTLAVPLVWHYFQLIMRMTMSLFRNWKDSKRDIVTASEGSPQKEAFDDLLAKSVAEQMEADASTFRIHLRCPPQLSQRANTILHRNPFDVEREDLVSQLSSLKFSLMHPTQWKGSEG